MARKISIRHIALFGFLATFLIPALVVINLRVFLTEKVFVQLINTQLNEALESNEQSIAGIFRTAGAVSAVVAEAAAANIADVRLESFNAVLWTAMQSSNYINSIYVALGDGYYRSFNRIVVEKAISAQGMPMKTKWSSGVIKSFKDSVGSRVRLDKYYDEFPNVLARNKVPISGSDIRATEHYIGASDKRDTYVSPPSRIFETKKLAVRMGAPITIDRNFVGIIGSDINLDAMINVLLENQASENSLALILDSKKQVIVSTDNFFQSAAQPKIIGQRLRVSKNLTLSEILKSRREGANQAIEINSQTGIKYWVSSKILPRSVGQDLEMIIIVPDEDFYSEIRDNNQKLFWLTVFFLVIACVIIYLFSRWLGEKINKVTFASIRARERAEILNGRKTISIKEVAEYEEALSSFETELGQLGTDARDGDVSVVFSSRARVKPDK